MKAQSDTRSKADRLLRIDAVLKRVPVSQATWYRGMAEGLYPRPLKIGKRASEWRESEIEELINTFDQQREDDMVDVLRRVAAGCSTVDDAKRIAEALNIKAGV